MTGDTHRRQRQIAVRRLALALVLTALAVGLIRSVTRGTAVDLFAALALDHLPHGERRLVEFLLLLPVAALVVCVWRNVVGLPSFGTFAPALIGLVFREWESLPGLSVFLGLILAGWWMRRQLDRLHLLPAARASVVLSFVIVLLIAFVAVASRWRLAVTQYASLFPVIILTGMIERFWAMESDDGLAGSLRTLLGTVVVALSVALVCGLGWLARALLAHPESLGLIVAGQVLLGRYTGYRLTELWRFRELAQPAPAAPREEALVLARTAPWRRF